MADGYNWSSSNQSVKVKSVLAVAVYTNVDDEVVIRQEGYGGEEDQVVYIPKANMASLMQALQEEMDKP